MASGGGLCGEEARLEDRATCEHALIGCRVEVLGLRSALALDVRTRKVEHQVETGVRSGQVERRLVDKVKRSDEHK